MFERTVELGDRSYPVVVTGDASPRLGVRLRELAPTGVFVVTDENVAAVALPQARAAVARSGAPLLGVDALPPGERTKSLRTLERLWKAFLAAGLDRKGVVLALGGGVVGDVAGFAAATWLRGVPVVHAPTTLLAMVDSAIGGKTGVDLEGKNLVGAFHQPHGVYASLDALATLPPAELRGGLGEVLKSAVLSGEELFARVERDAAALARGDLAALEPVIAGCVDLKAGIVARDERETGERALLNLGHTLGHALEALSGFASETLRHGEAVAIGLNFVARLAVRLGRLEPAVLARIQKVARALGLPLHGPGFSPPRALELMRKDKKATGGALRLVLPFAIGRAEVVGGLEEALVLDELAVFTGERR